MNFRVIPGKTAGNTVAQTWWGYITNGRTYWEAAGTEYRYRYESDGTVTMCFIGRLNYTNTGCPIGATRKSFGSDEMLYN